MFAARWRWSVRSTICYWGPHACDDASQNPHMFFGTLSILPFRQGGFAVSRDQPHFYPGNALPFGVVWYRGLGQHSQTTWTLVKSTLLVLLSYHFHLIFLSYSTTWIRHLSEQKIRAENKYIWHESTLISQPNRVSCNIKSPACMYKTASVGIRIDASTCSELTFCFFLTSYTVDRKNGFCMWKMLTSGFHPHKIHLVRPSMDQVNHLYTLKILGAPCAMASYDTLVAHNAIHKGKNSK